MPKFIDMTGQTHGRLLVLSRHGVQGKGQASWRCVCNCGNETVVRGDQLRSGHTQSCGCLQPEAMRAAVQTHGRSRTRLHSIWLQMKRRCLNPASACFAYYGGRGIKVCERWAESFEAFASDMGEPPTTGHTLDRENNDGDYCPENCRWATRAEQMRNRRVCRHVEIDGQTKTITEWRREFGIAPGTLYKRLARGLSVQEALGVTHQRPLSAGA